MAGNNQDIHAALVSARARAVAEIEGARSKLTRAEAELNRIETALGVIEEYGGHPKPEQPRLIDVPAQGPSPDLSRFGMTIGEAAFEILKAAGKPLKNRQIAERMVDADFRYDGDIKKLRNAVGVAMVRMAEAGEGVEKLARGVFRVPPEPKAEQ